MNHATYRSAKQRSAWAAFALLLCMPAYRAAQAATRQTSAPQAASQVQRLPLDRVVAIVNGQLIMQSDVEEERRFLAFEPYRDESAVTDNQLIDRLVDRTLIEQQEVQQPQPPIPEDKLDAEIAALRKTIPECAAYHCETDAGWQKYLADHGFTMQELRDRWRQRMEVLQFIEVRFRTGILDTITQAQIDDYYKKTLLPAYAKQKATPPKEDTIASRIQEILLQQQVTNLMDDWLKSLRAQGTVKILQPGEVAP